MDYKWTWCKPTQDTMVELILDIKTGHFDKAWLCPIDCQYVCCHWVCRKLGNNNPKSDWGWCILKNTSFLKRWAILRTCGDKLTHNIQHKILLLAHFFLFEGWWNLLQKMEFKMGLRFWSTWRRLTTLWAPQLGKASSSASCTTWTFQSWRIQE